ncbi:DUF2207 family protein [Nitriliruptor alkaliphilus]|uniref:DUF2207 family protein n=1 Tax=Nitriliruptor alkaliphilus TaxID=427918 RepID=UPI000695C9A7|nr:DUF2207 domain-containing protein [Nitriliruptor alkaliphilus]
MKTGTKTLISAILVVVYAAAILVTAVLVPNLGRDRAFTIDQFTRTVSLAPGGELDVSERIEVTFHEPRRGIFRDLELDGPAGRVTYQVRSVDRGTDGDGWHYVQERTPDGEPRIRIGDAAIWLDPGPQTYRLGYTAAGLSFRPEARPDQVQLRIDVPGDAWPTDVTATELVVQLPAPPTDVRCVHGRTGATTACEEAQVTGTTVTQRIPPLPPRATATVAVEVPAVALPAGPALPERSVRELGDRSLLAPVDVPAVPGALLVAGLVALPALALEGARSRRVYRDEVTDAALHDREAPTAELEPPDGLAPVELAALLRRNPDHQQLLATLVDLEIRGVVATSSGRGGSPLTIGPGPQAREARPWEAAMLEGLCPGGTPLTFRDKYAPETAKRSGAALGALGRHVMGILGGRSRYTHRRGGALRGNGYSLLVLLSLVLGWMVAVAGARLLGVGLSLAVVAVVALVVTWIGLATVWRHERLPLTSEGRDAIARARAFRSYLAEVHADRLEFAASQAEIGTTHPAVALLPYAISLGLADSWHARFEPLMQSAAQDGRAGATSANTWYVHRTAYTGAVAAQTRSVTAPSSSSSGGGGGGSGSGGGGGGGGSW